MNAENLDPEMARWDSFETNEAFDAINWETELEKITKLKKNNLLESPYTPAICLE